MRKYYKHKLVDTLYRSEKNTTELTIRYANSKWEQSCRDTAKPNTMLSLEETSHPQSWLFATIAITMSLLLLAFL